GMSFAYRCSRPDILGMICLLLILLSFSIQRARTRECCLVVLTALTFWIGLQVAFFVVFAYGAASLVFRRFRPKEILVLALGLALGLCSLLAFLSWKHALEN